jgi:hypothetical protein
MQDECNAMGLQSAHMGPAALILLLSSPQLPKTLKLEELGLVFVSSNICNQFRLRQPYFGEP